MKAIFVVSKEFGTKIQAALDAEAHRGLYEGDNGDVQWYQHVNQNQRVLVSERTVTVEGERCALWGDHNATAMALLRDSKVAPVSYHTSDTRLAWHETLADLHERTLKKWGKLTPVQESAALTPEEKRLLVEARNWHKRVYGHD